MKLLTLTELGITPIAKCPVPYMQGAVERYVYQGIPPGSFLTALLTNNLSATVGHADETNIQYLREWVSYVYHSLPHNCHGSPEVVMAWCGLMNRKTGHAE